MIFDHCWICSVRFTDAKPAGPANRENHHIIPRQAGGADGPQVSLCENHHGKAHKIAMRMSSNKPYFDLLSGEPDAAKQKLLWLASRIFTAFEAVKGDPNKKVMVVMTLDRKKQKQLQMLQKVYPQAKSREAIYDLALQSLFNRNFSS
jgi:hypothetical protein